MVKDVVAVIVVVVGLVGSALAPCFCGDFGVWGWMFLGGEVEEGGVVWV